MRLDGLHRHRLRSAPCPMGQDTFECVHGLAPAHVQPNLPAVVDYLAKVLGHRCLDMDFEPQDPVLVPAFKQRKMHTSQSFSEPNDSGCDFGLPMIVISEPPTTTSQLARACTHWPTLAFGTNTQPGPSASILKAARNLIYNHLAAVDRCQSLPWTTHLHTCCRCC